MNYNELIESVNNFDVENDKMYKIVNNIDIKSENINEWISNVFSEKTQEFDMNKLPYLIDELYRSRENLKFMLSCMLLESTCDRINFITNLEDYPLNQEKFKIIANTLVTIYEHVDNGISNCMALIILKNDPNLVSFDEELKTRLQDSTEKKLTLILNYLKKEKINPVVYNDLEIIVDLACGLKSKKISELIDQIDKTNDNENADIFIIKYKILNNMKVLDEKINTLKKEDEKIYTLYSVLERLNKNETYLKDISQERIAKSEMINWLEYPTELGAVPDKIELLGEFNFNDQKIYAYKFSKENFKISGDLIGISGGYPLDKVSSNASGYTFSDFENVEENWEEQAKKIAEKIYSHWKSYTKK